MKIIPDTGSHSGIVKLAGEIDLCCVPEIRRRLEEELSKGVSTLIVDLTEVTFMDSSGLSVIIEYWRHMYEQGGKLLVAGAKGEVLEVFRITRLDQYIALFATDAEAISAGNMAA